MYTAFNDRVVVRKPIERRTDSGIILAEQDEGAVFELEVIETTEVTAKLKGKTILVERRMIREFPHKTDGAFYGAVKVEDILAIKN